jgi:WD40 repeat protein
MVNAMKKKVGNPARCLGWFSLVFLISSCVGQKIIPGYTATTTVTSTFLQTGTPTFTAAISLTPSSENKTAQTPTAGQTVASTPYQFQQVSLSFPDRVQGLTFSQDGSRLVAGYGSSDGSVIVWDVPDIVQSGQINQFSLEVPPSGMATRISSVAFSFDGQLLAAGSATGDVLIWDAAAMQEGASPTRILRLADTGLVFSPYVLPDSFVVASPRDGTLAVAYAPSSDQGAVLLWDFYGGKILKTFFAKYAGNMAISPDGKLLAVTGDQPALWGITTGRGVREYDIESPTGVAFSPDGQTLAIATLSGTVDLVETYRREIIWTFDCQDFIYSNIVFSPDGKWIAVGVGKDVFLITADGSGFRKFGGNIKTIESVAFSQDGKILASGDWSGTIVLWNVEELLNKKL